MSVKKTSNGNWEYRFNFKNQRYSATFKTKKECVQAEKQRKKELENGIGVKESNNSSNLKVSELLDIYFNDYVEKYCKIGSKECYRNYQNHINKAFGDIKVVDLKPIDIQYLVDDLAEKGFTKRHINTIKNYFKKVLNYAIYPLEVIDRNVCDYIGIKNVHGKKSKTDSFDDKKFKKQLNDIMNYIRANDPDYEIVFDLFLGTGLRKGEVLGLTWDNVDLENNTLYVCQQLTKKATLKPLKVEGTERYITITNTLADKLRKQNQMFPNSKFVCCDKKGVNIKQHSLNYRIEKIRKNVPNCENFHCHLTRKYHSSILNENGINVNEIAHRLGHKNTSTTLNIYIKRIGTQEKEVLDILENNLH